MTTLTNDINSQNQLKSGQRVSDHGEVFTAQREVNAMLDLVKDQTERIDSRFLEPACGTGNFLVEILKRKLAKVRDRYSKSQIEYERYAIIAISSIYGIDILEDNAAECRKRLFKIFNQEYTSLYKEKSRDDCCQSVKFILNRNIIWGDALTLQTVGLIPKPIVFSEWSLITGSFVQRRDFTFKSLVENQPINSPNLFSDLGEEAFIPQPVKPFFPPTNIFRLAIDEQYEL